ncbi:sensor histidine kinase [Nocardioides limicola]|uniref:sensor histidine kinase n=1 Tax=Nocardioides limicola TaxID=2803368 RepID=UPI00193B0B15|nr:ATP-binding protein [Nocardioides sp. DJM-14]
MRLRPRDRARARARSLSLAQQVLVLLLALVVLLIGAGTAAAVLDAQRGSAKEAERRAVALAQALAVLAVPVYLDEQITDQHTGGGSAALQPLAEAVRARTGTDFIVFMTLEGTRLSHPNPDLIGGTFLGTIGPAAAGGVVTETYEGTLGTSVRAVVPILDGDDPIGLVSVGILQEQIWTSVRRDIALIVLVGLLALALALAGAWAISRRLDRLTHGLGPVEITRMYEHHQAVLHAVREGLIVVGADRTVVLANDEAVNLLDLPAEHVGRDVGDLPLPPALADLLGSGARAADELFVCGDRLLVVSQRPTIRDGVVLGTVTTLRDHTELEALTGELETTRGFAEALRAQVHEAANRLHAVVMMVETGEPERAVEFATAEIESSQQLADSLMASVSDPAVAALLLGKTAQARQRGVELTVDAHGEIGFLSDRELVTLIGNLVDNAIDVSAQAEPPRWVGVALAGDAEGLRVRVSDSGPGLDPAQADEAFRWGWSTKSGDERPHGRGLGLALVQQIVAQYGGSVHTDRDPAVVEVWLPAPGSERARS